MCHGQELDVFKFLSTLCKLSNTYQAKIIRPILQRNAATLLELKRFLNLANPKNVMSTQIQKPLNPPSLQIDDVAEDSARQRFANYMRLQKRNARGDQTKKKEVAYFGT